MRFALLMTGAFVAVTGSTFVFLFVAMWYGAIQVERAVQIAMQEWFYRNG